MSYTHNKPTSRNDNYYTYIHYDVGCKCKESELRRCLKCIYLLFHTLYDSILVWLQLHSSSTNIVTKQLYNNFADKFKSLLNHFLCSMAQYYQ